ncbi:MAG: hypothetical protein M0R74_12390 [Dehalococcoidia bacterium]|nr:hypothetical protein [Dehalococcoidia bacterium]
MTRDVATTSRADAILSGAGFGLTSGVLTTLGLIVGLHSGTDTRQAVAAGVATIALADAFSDAFGLHISQESSGVDQRAAWLAAGVTFVAKLTFALTFLVPILLLPLGVAVLVSIGWGLLVLVGFTWWVTRRNEGDVRAAVGEHLLVAIVVLTASQGVGNLLGRLSD